MCSRFDMTYIRPAEFFDVLQYIVQLLLESVCFPFSQINPSQYGDVPNIEIRSRRVHFAGCTTNPTGAMVVV